MIAEGEANPQRGGGCCLFLGGGRVAQPARRGRRGDWGGDK